MNQTLTIQPGHTLAEVCTAFQAMYPQLKLQFVNPGKPALPEHFVLDVTLPVNSLYPVNEPVTINTSAYVLTAAFEKSMEEAGLHVQVFRFSGRVWLETVQTDHLSLHEQQVLSNLHSSPADEKGTDEVDYD